MDRDPRQPDERLAGSGTPRQPSAASPDPDRSGSDVEREGEAAEALSGDGTARPGAIPSDEL